MSTDRTEEYWKIYFMEIADITFAQATEYFNNHDLSYEQLCRKLQYEEIFPDLPKSINQQKKDKKNLMNVLGLHLNNNFKNVNYIKNTIV